METRFGLFDIIQKGNRWQFILKKDKSKRSNLFKTKETALKYANKEEVEILVRRYKKYQKIIISKIKEVKNKKKTYSSYKDRRMESNFDEIIGMYSNIYIEYEDYIEKLKNEID